jgi:hypothetical protein
VVVLANVAVACPRIMFVFRSDTCTGAPHLVTLLKLTQNRYVGRVEKYNGRGICVVNHSDQALKFCCAGVGSVGLHDRRM